MQLTDAFNGIIKQLEKTNEELGFKISEKTDNSVVFKGDRGIYRMVYDDKNTILSFDCAYEEGENGTEFNTVSRTLFDINHIDDRDIKSAANEARDEIEQLFNARKKVNLDKVKMPKAVSRTKAKNGVISYDCDSLANRFGALYPEFKEDIKKNIVKYGEFLPETFFTEIGTPKVIDVIKNGNSADQKRLFKMLNEVYEDGTNEVQDVIGVTILGAMQNDKDMMAVADKYMSDYMSGPVHEINKLTAKKGSSLMKKLKNPPAYKPKKKKNNFMQNALQAQDINR